MTPETFALLGLGFLLLLALLAAVADLWDRRRTADSRSRNQAHPKGWQR